MAGRTYCYKCNKNYEHGFFKRCPKHLIALGWEVNDYYLHKKYIDAKSFLNRKR